MRATKALPTVIATVMNMATGCWADRDRWQPPAGGCLAAWDKSACGQPCDLPELYTLNRPPQYAELDPRITLNRPPFVTLNRPPPKPIGYAFRFPVSVYR